LTVRSKIACLVEVVSGIEHQLDPQRWDRLRFSACRLPSLLSLQPGKARSSRRCSEPSSVGVPGGQRVTGPL
jgi:hypothetical protein